MPKQIIGQIIPLTIGITPDALAEAIQEAKPDALIEVIKIIDEMQADWQGFTLPLAAYFLGELRDYAEEGAEDDSDEGLRNDVIAHLANKLATMLNITLGEVDEDGV